MIPAIILAPNHLNTVYAKTTHALVRGGDRYKILGVIDPDCAGMTTSEVLPHCSQATPIFSSVKQALQHTKPQHCIIGLSNKGGTIDQCLLQELEDAIKNRLVLVNGLHEYLSEHPFFSTLAKQYNTTLLDIRKPKPTKELKFWTGAISEVEAPRIVVMGTDCAVGKRSTCVLLLQALIQANEKAEMIYTGQTGYLLGYRYGFILDSTLNDFIAGELEAAIMQCVKETQPQWICIEGQSSLQNPSGPCGSEFLLSAQAKYVVLQHAPKRLHFKQKSKNSYTIPSLESTLDLIQTFGATTIAITLNTSGLSHQEIQEERSKIEKKYKLPVYLPFEEGLKALALSLIKIREENENQISTNCI